MDRTGGGRPTAIDHDDIRALVKALTHKDKKTAQSAHLSLLALGAAALEFLTEATHSKDVFLRWEAARTLAAMRLPAAAPILVEELTNTDEDVRWLAAEGLIALGKDGLADLLKAVIEQPTNTRRLQGAHHVISDLVKGRVHPGEEKYMTIYDLPYTLKEKLMPVLQALEDPEPVLRLSGTVQPALDYLHGH